MKPNDLTSFCYFIFICYFSLPSYIICSQSLSYVPTIIRPNDGVDGDDFSYSFDIDGSGEYMVVGSRYDDEQIIHQGSAYVFRKQDDETWLQVQKLDSPEPERNSYFGWAVSISLNGDFVAVSSVRKDNVDQGKSSTGSIYIFKKSQDQWQLHQTIIGPNQISQAKLGDYLDISDDATTLVASEGGGNNEVQVFELNGSLYSHTQSLTHGTRSFTHKVVMADSQIFVSHYSDDVDEYKDAGEIWVYQKMQDSWNLNQKIRMPTLVSGAQFSWHFNVNDGYLVANSSELGNHQVHIYKSAGNKWEFKKSLGPLNNVNYHSLNDVVISDDYIVISEDLKVEGQTGYGDHSFLLFENSDRFTILDSIKLGKRMENHGNPLKIINNKLYASSYSDGPGSIYEYKLEIPDPQPRFYDINPKFLDVTNNTQLDGSIKSEDLFTKLKRLVSGTTADKISEILVAVPINEKVNISQWHIDSGHGSFRFPWSHSSQLIDSQNYFIAIYSPPDGLPNTDSLKTTENGVSLAQIPIKIRYLNDSGEDSIQFNLKLYAPPVVLVHGTFDNPLDCWTKGLSDAGNGMYQHLQNQNLKIFLCDYSATNGNPLNYQSKTTSRFEANKSVVYENPGGIRDAINYYRDTLNIACTKADVVGHSMGGVLARVYASDRGESISSYDNDYYRADNFMSGDINRLITISSTHHGSDLAWFVLQLKGASYPDFYKFFYNLATLNFSNLNSSFIGGMYALATTFNSLSGALIDQVPRSPALQKIGPTPIPAHAIATYVNDIDDIKYNPVDEESLFFTNYDMIWWIAMSLYFKDDITDAILNNIALEWQRLPNHLKVPKDRYYKSYKMQFVDDITKDLDEFRELYKAPLEKNWLIFYALNDLFREQSIPIMQYESTESSINDFDNDENENFIERKTDIIKGEYLVDTKVGLRETLDDLVNRYRFFIFKNDWNDGTVRYESQTGSLDDQKYVSIFSEHLHSYTPRYPEIQKRVSDLLKGGLDEFAPDGFPNAGRQLPIWLPDMTDIADDDVTGCEAACWSGMVPSHAMAWARVADSENVVILNRPVNPDATPLIFNNASTKGMNLKGKSSDWGPQKGMIAVEQRYSKLFSLYEGDAFTKIAIEFDEKVKKLLDNSPNEAVKRQLEVQYSQCSDLGGEEFLGWVTKSKSSPDTEIRMTLKSNSDQVFIWTNNSSACPLEACSSNCDLSDLDPFYVLANPDSTITAANNNINPIYTADYDLLAIGFHNKAQEYNPKHPYPRPNYTPPELFFDCEIGNMTERQRELLSDLNQSVISLGYLGGNVSHHGPENQFTNMSFTSFPCSDEKKPKEITANPYFDYPITAFEPDNDLRASSGIVRTIEMGPPGFKDINLKRYIAEMRRKGYNIIANPDSPSWQWEYWRPYSYEDGYDLRDYPGLPLYPEQLPRPNFQKCIEMYGCEDLKATSVIKNEQITESPKVRIKPSEDIHLYPNPYRSGPFSVIVHSDKNESYQLRIIDMLGRQISNQLIHLDKGMNQLWLDITDLNLQTGAHLIIIENDSKFISTSLIIQE